MKPYILLAMLWLTTISIAFSQEIANHELIEEHQETQLSSAGIKPHEVRDELILTFGGYLETFYSHNFNKPSNNLNALRGFDFINNSLTVGNFVLATDAKYNNFSMRLAINIGMTPSQFYKQEPTTSSSYQIPSLNSATWSLIQEAVVNYDFENVKGLSLQMGIMATPIGIEGLPSFQTWESSSANPGIHKKDYRENWNFSRSNAFIHVPDYHSGVRLLYSPTPKSTYSFYLINGQNMVTDNNNSKTMSFSYLWTPNPKVHFSALYMGGNERPRDYQIKNTWRHLFDFHTKFSLTKKMVVMAQVLPGTETSALGTNRFLISALYLKYEMGKKNHVAMRYEHLLEKVARGHSSNFLQTFDENNEAGLFGLTTTYSHVLVPNHLMLRLEHRYDYGTQNWFFKGELQNSGNEDYPFITNTDRQNTLSFSLVGWF